jgi:tripartite-type tricarboxylate transporter receptor subunit TctC
LNRQLLSFCFGFICFNAMAQNMAWPEKSVRVIVPFAAGGAGDVVARIITPRLSEHFGQTFIVENKLGA